MYQLLSGQVVHATSLGGLCMLFRLSSTADFQLAAASCSGETLCGCSGDALPLVGAESVEDPSDALA